MAINKELYEKKALALALTGSASFDRPPRPGSQTRANAEIKRLLCMAHATYDPKALNALTRALVAQGFGK